MFFSLAQTLVCVLLINGGMYALHLTGNGGGGGGVGSGGSNSAGSGSSGSAGGHNSFAGIGGIGTIGSHQDSNAQHQSQSQAVANRMLHALGASLAPGGGVQHHQQMQQHHQQHTQHAGGGGGVGTSGGGGASIHHHASFDQNRLNQELADMAQLERERLMLMGLAKQTAAAAAAAEGTGHHGRPIIAGRVQMHPRDDEVDVSDYPALLQQAARGLMFGNVVKEAPVPSPLDPENDYEDQQMFARRPIKYDYGRIVQPVEREEYEAQRVGAAADAGSIGGGTNGGFGDFDDFMELEAAADEDDLLADLDNYQYHGWEEQPHQSTQPHHVRGFEPNPYRSLDELELGAPENLQTLFDKEQRDHGHKQPQFAANPSGYNIRMQQRWTRKRSGGGAGKLQPQTQFQRNIFGHHFNQQRNKLSLATSEATATKPLGEGQATTRSGGVVPDVTTKHVKSTNDEEKSNVNENEQQADDKKSTTTLLSSDNKQPQDQLQQQQLLHPNHKRSGVAASISGAGGAGGNFMQTPPVSHSLASQLMLRTARGQRQYDVPQIECPTAMDGMERFACPTPDLQGRYRCIDDHVLCDGFIDCPEGEDEDRRSCMFYKTTKAHLDVLADALLRWARGR